MNARNRTIVKVSLALISLAVCAVFATFTTSCASSDNNGGSGGSSAAAGTPAAGTAGNGNPRHPLEIPPCSAGGLYPRAETLSRGVRGCPETGVDEGRRDVEED